MKYGLSDRYPKDSVYNSRGKYLTNWSFGATTFNHRAWSWHHCSFQYSDPSLPNYLPIFSNFLQLSKIPLAFVTQILISSVYPPFNSATWVSEAIHLTNHRVTQHSQSRWLSLPNTDFQTYSCPLNSQNLERSFILLTFLSKTHKSSA